MAWRVLLWTAARADDVLLVGAGQAGMAAAHELSKAQLSFTVLEATDHVGGRTRNVDVRTGAADVASDDVVEIGGTWLSPAHTAALRLARELGLEVYNASFVDGTAEPPPEEDWPWWYWGSDYPKEQWPLLGKSVLWSSKGRELLKGPGELLSALAPAAQQLRRAEELLLTAKEALQDECWSSNGSLWHPWDGETTWSALSSGLGADAQQALRNCIHAKNAQEPEAVSFLYNLLSFKGCNSQGPDSQFRLRGGSQALALRLAQQVPVRLRHEVTEVRALQEGVEVTVQQPEGTAIWKAKALILTGPPPAILRIGFSPPLGAADAQWLQRMPMGSSLKLAAVYRQGPWWRRKGFQGDILATQLPRNLSLPSPYEQLPLFVQCMDHSPYSQDLGVIVCFMEGRQNLHFTGLPLAQQRRLFIDFLVLSFGAEAEHCEVLAHNWADQPFARGAYTGFFPPGVMSVPEYWAAFQQMEKLPNVFLAGSDYHIGFGNGYIEGAIRDGQKAAQKVIARLKGSVVI